MSLPRVSPKQIETFISSSLSMNDIRKKDQTRWVTWLKNWMENRRNTCWITGHFWYTHNTLNRSRESREGWITTIKLNEDWYKTLMMVAVTVLFWIVTASRMIPPEALMFISKVIITGNKCHTESNYPTYTNPYHFYHNTYPLQNEKKDKHLQQLIVS